MARLFFNFFFAPLGAGFREPFYQFSLIWQDFFLTFFKFFVTPCYVFFAKIAFISPLCQTLERLDQWNTYCVLVMPDHIHLLTAPLERELSVAATAL
jgi:hypothetical protein